MQFRSIEDFDLISKKIIARIGIDSQYDPEKKEIIDNDRIEEQAKFLTILSQKKARICAIAHQSRPGKEDFTDLSVHARLLSKHSGIEVKFIPDIAGEKAIQAIESLKDGEIILLDNVRKHPDEMKDASPKEHSKSSLIKKLEPHFDYYINNAFSNSHRSHASMVGFTKIPVIAGPLVINEVKAGERALKNAKRPCIYILGGLKIFDQFTLIEKVLSNNLVDKILACGTLGELCIIANGKNLGKKDEFLLRVDSMEKKSLMDLLPRVKILLKKYPDKFEIPIDVAEEINGKRNEIMVDSLPSPNNIWDIGEKTARIFSEIIKKANTIYLKGAPGDYRVLGFSKGSEIIIRSIAESDAYSLIGGGSAVDMIERYSSKSHFSHVSVAGGALLWLLAGKKLPALEILKI